MIYDVRQTTTYAYESNVTYAHHVLRLTPIDRAHQRVHATALDITPVPVERREGFDFFGNRVTWIGLDAPHDELIVQVAARIAVEDAVEPDAEASAPWESVREAAFATTDIGPQSPAHFLFASRQVSLDPEIRDYAAKSFLPGRPILAGAAEMMRRIKADFVYAVGATTVTTTPPMSFALRRGVCQDFAHIMISGLRGLGLPAAYVSGYLRTVAVGSTPRLAGADAMHAWVLVWAGAGAGWFGLDPTNAVRAGGDHVVLAVGRDYADAAPVDGVAFTSGRQRLDVSVSVIPVGAAE
jgi:transglutaminase-like putative cysteine protease